MPELTAPQPPGPVPYRRWLARLLKALVAAVLAAIILVVGGLSILLLTFDPNQYKAMLIQVVKEREHRTLALPGNIALQLFPPLTLRTGPFTLSERDSNAVFARADDLRLHLDWMALLHRKLVVDRVVMVRPQVHVLRDAQGQFNFADLLPSDRPDAAPRSPLGLSVHRLQVEQGALTYDDDKAQVHGVLSALDLELSGLDGGIPGSLRLGASARFARPALVARVDLRGKLQTDPAQHSVALSDLNLSLQGDGFGLKALHSRIDLARLVLITRQTLSVRLQQWQMQTTGRSADGVMRAQASLPLLERDGDALHLGALHATLQLPGIEAQLGTAEARGSSSALRIPAAQLQWRHGTAGQAGALQLSAASPLQIDPAQWRLDLPALALTGQLVTATAGTHTLALRGTAHYAAAAGAAPASAQFQLQGTVDGSAVKAAGNWTPPAALKLNLDADRIRLDDWLPPAAAGGAQPRAPAQIPVDLSAFENLALNLQFKVGSLLLGQLQCNALQGTLGSDRTRLILQPLSAQCVGGTLGTSLQVDLASRRFTLHQTARDVSVQPIVQALTGRDFLLGKAGWTLDLAAQGKTLQALIASLSGKARLDVRDGALKGFDLAQLLRHARTNLAARRNARFVITPGERTDFATLGVSFALQDGVAQSADLSIQAPPMRVAGEGWLDLPAQRMDWLLLPTVAGPLQGKFGAELAPLRTVTVPIRLSGRFAQPDNTVLWAQAGTQVPRQALKNSLQDALRRQRAPSPAEAKQRTAPGLFKGLLP